MCGQVGAEQACRRPKTRTLRGALPRAGPLHPTIHPLPTRRSPARTFFSGSAPCEGGSSNVSATCCGSPMPAVSPSIHTLHQSIHP